jgi:hypothetical protein
LDFIWKAILVFCRVAHWTVRCTTGHCPASDFLPKWAQSTVAVLEPLVHRTLSGAHRTVRCTHLTVGSATRHARIARPTVGAVDCWLTGQSGAPPDSPVNYSCTPPDFPESGLFTGVQPRASDTVRCTTRHCPVHHRTVRCARLSRVLAVHSQAFCISFLFFFFLFLTLRQVY